MKGELRVQFQGSSVSSSIRFQPEAHGILLLGGDKTGDDRWYEVNVPIADRLYDQHLRELKVERKKEASGDG